jgi:hypothetical protein
VKKEELNLRKLYGDIIVGFTKAKFNEKVVYIRHFSPIEQGEIDGEYIFLYDNALANGLRPEKDVLESLMNKGLWNEDNEKFIEKQGSYLDNLKKTKANLMYESQIEDINKRIADVEKKLNEKKNERASLLGMTIEKYCDRKMSEIYILKSMYEDNSFSVPIFSDEVFDQLDDSELDTAMIAYSTHMEGFRDKNFKKIALAPFFQSHFDLCDDNIFNFYGKPIVSLSYFQAEIARYGKFFKYILSGEQKPSSDLLEDPDKLIEWYNMTRNAEKHMRAHQNNSSVAFIGAGEKDMKNIAGDSGEVVSFQKIAAQEGKTKLNKKDIMALLGV